MHSEHRVGNRVNSYYSGIKSSHSVTSDFINNKLLHFCKLFPPYWPLVGHKQDSRFGSKTPKKKTGITGLPVSEAKEILWKKHVFYSM